MAYVVHEELTAEVPSGNQVAVTFPDDITPQDTLVLMIGGGNQVTSYPDGWESIDFRTGQEAQGRVLVYKSDTVITGGMLVTIGFDGNDRCGVGKVHVRGDCGVEIVYAERVGSVGAALGGYNVNADTFENELTYLFSFQRNSGGGQASVADATLVGTLPNGSEGTSLYRVAHPEPDTATWTTTPGRSGHYLAAVGIYSPIYGSTAQTEEFWLKEGQWVAGGHSSGNTTVVRARDDLEYGEENPIYSKEESANRVRGGANYTIEGVPMDVPAINQFYQTRLASFTAEPRRWLTNWNQFYRRLELFPGQPQEPTDLLPPEADAPEVVDILWTDNERKERRFVIESTFVHAQDNSGSFPPNTWYKWWICVDSSENPIDFQSPGSILGMHNYGSVTFVEQEPGDPGITATIPAPDIPLSFVGELRFLAVDFLSVNGGFVPDTESTLPQGMSLNFDVAVDFRYRPTYQFVYRGMVTVGTPAVSVLRRYPRDDAYGFGNVARNYPPPRRRRNYGQQP